jgi:hypothetical protein
MKEKMDPLKKMYEDSLHKIELPTVEDIETKKKTHYLCQEILITMHKHHPGKTVGMNSVLWVAATMAIEFKIPKEELLYALSKVYSSMEDKA